MQSAATDLIAAKKEKEIEKENDDDRDVKDDDDVDVEKDEEKEVDTEQEAQAVFENGVEGVSSLSRFLDVFFFSLLPRDSRHYYYVND